MQEIVQRNAEVADGRLLAGMPVQQARFTQSAVNCTDQTVAFPPHLF